MEDNVILKVSNLKTYFDVTKGLFSPKQIVKAVDGVSFDVKKGETFGLVGESGCGKSTLGRTIVKLYEPVEGTIEFEGKDIRNIKGAELKEFRKKVQMIFQDPYASLNPRMTVGEIIMEPMIIHNIYQTAEEREARTVELLNIVGLKPDHIRRYPSEFSGGQRQRIGIARALYGDPEILVLDEATSALDSETESAVMEAIDRLHGRKTLLIIAHRLTTIRNCEYIYRVENGNVYPVNKEELYG
jgi:oligopeptide transport system ATP-binding protein